MKTVIQVRPQTAALLLLWNESRGGSPLEGRKDHETGNIILEMDDHMFRPLEHHARPDETDDELINRMLRKFPAPELERGSDKSIERILDRFNVRDLSLPAEETTEKATKDLSDRVLDRSKVCDPSLPSEETPEKAPKDMSDAVILDPRGPASEEAKSDASDPSSVWQLLVKMPPRSFAALALAVFLILPAFILGLHLLGSGRQP